jgi:hypothetical protein
MQRFTLLVGGLLLLTAALALPTFTVRAASIGRFEYLRLEPGLPQVDLETGKPISTAIRAGYIACVAGRPATEKCREFEDPGQQLRAMEVALSTLGNEGWELVSVIDETVNQSSPKGLTYVFKRQIAR